ncbi:pyridoxamine 5'-phosphate oxidase family protein [Kitasatospora sp. NPDC088134]|uniref:pyridoxamine 5'-phosphate oxidase family protein n=1 Tax=Kitasatospora sp. NPDC088134 TaxID=3364071 RepID=UPI003805D77D
MDRDDRMETLSEAECLRLLGTVPLGRVVYTEHALPAVLPVAFRVSADGRLVLALRAGSRVARALDGTVAAFQVDDFDRAGRCGWSVLVHGRAEVVRGAGERAGYETGGLRPWLPEPGPEYVAIAPELVSGRRMLPDPEGTAAPALPRRRTA